MTLTPIDLPDVHRVERREHGGTSSHVEPAIDDGWDEPTKLAWHAAITAHDTGLAIHLYSGAHDGDPDTYSINVETSSAAPFDYRGAWTYLNGVAVGAIAERYRHFRPRTITGASATDR